jgi:quercetin dioxygenase-like cupin family protein
MQQPMLSERLPRAIRATLRVVAVAALMPVWPTAEPATWAQEERAINAAPIQHSETFRGSAMVLSKNGRRETVRVTIDLWTILGEQKIAEFQEHGFLLVQLLGGKATTVIDGKEQKRLKGEFWVVPANSRMSILTTGETASLEVTRLSI